jgi:glycosyltransferase involved in cell wall biosynthesis
MNKLTVLVPCYNNQDIIRDCLESARWADEILVCDSFSSDATLDIARKYTDRIIQHEYINSATQKNWAIPQASHEWVFILDTDERLTGKLKDEIISVLKNPGEFQGFKVPRANYSFGRRLRHGGYWPDYQLRLFKKDKGRYEPREVHAHVILEGRQGYLKSPLIHLCDRSLQQVIRKLLVRYARWEAKERLKKERFSFLKLITKPPLVFGYRYVYLKGFLDGWSGLLVAMLWSIYIFMTYLHMWRWKENG